MKNILIIIPLSLIVLFSCKTEKDKQHIHEGALGNKKELPEEQTETKEEVNSFIYTIDFSVLTPEKIAENSGGDCETTSWSYKVEDGTEVILDSINCFDYGLTLNYFHLNDGKLLARHDFKNTNELLSADDQFIVESVYYQIKNDSAKRIKHEYKGAKERNKIDINQFKEKDFNIEGEVITIEKANRAN